ncbi:4Fe-4S dicluster domain-containing protein [Candidatus Acidulodesulfobacterium sp. H_13]|uniref:NADH-quinone oxidoreductase subunit B family protein n=1 Tax=Candidatus Acidulodesulfobacterium sp. H_13 TaxID=3395470 RepID=UPI003AF98331
MAFFWTYNGLKFGIKSVKFPKKNDFYDGFISSINFDENKCLNSKGLANLSEKNGDLKCMECESVCPTGAISLHDIYNNSGGEGKTSRKSSGALDANRCIFCGLCVDTCSDIASAINYGKDLNFYASPFPGNDRGNIFKRSLFVKHIDTGSCGACESEINALSNPYYNIHRLGIFITPSPRFADVLLVTGAYTKKMSDIFFNVLENIPRPRYIVLMGSCSLFGGIFKNGSKDGNDGLLFNNKMKKLFKEDNVVALPHCPPNPFEILNVLLLIKKGDFK